MTNKLDRGGQFRTYHQRMPTDDGAWAEFIRSFDDLSAIVDNLSDSGRVTKSSALPTVAALGKSSAVTGMVAPLTATDAGADATINIAAHTYQIGAEQVSFNAGSIAGLAYETTYWVYADDADLEGGAVTYLATTEPATATASEDRAYVGKITTPAAAGPDTSGGGGGGAGGGETPDEDGIWP